ncbi:hypothetical protein PHYPSEUDO_001389 [Phytophthora pseudosyringae]|uniref:Uncharacterized protein n=1 Tax=Phytophthora pseudosyringae TaxID=221518 RepID=A0A8T1WGG8_9STRA|nr:hypothetical protein PHYPSEUDO_001389 [Phytophthora pseudosyringae]
MSTTLYASYERQERRRLKRKREQFTAEPRGFIRNTKQKTVALQNLAALMNEATNEGVALSKRLKLALDMREKMFRLDVHEVVRLMSTQQHLIVKLADALLHTAYVPLQLLLFMSLTALLSTLNGTRSEQTATVRQRLRENVRDLDKVLLSALPVDEVVEVIDPGNALWVRKQVNALNRSSKVCRTYILRKCWVSSCGKDKLMPIAVDKWLDLGGTTLTFYHQLPRETILYNIPYASVVALDFDEANSLAFVYIQQVLGLGGINLVAFVVETAEFTELRTTLSAVRPENATLRHTRKSAVIHAVHLKTTTTSFQHCVRENKGQLPLGSPGAHSMSSMRSAARTDQLTKSS